MRGTPTDVQPMDHDDDDTVVQKCLLRSMLESEEKHADVGITFKGFGNVIESGGNAGFISERLLVSRSGSFE